MTTETRIAAAFIARLRAALNHAQLVEIDRRNSTPGYIAACASHDFCDANMPMGEAFRAVTGRDPDPASEDDARLINAAWDAARAAGFAPTARDAFNARMARLRAEAEADPTMRDFLAAGFEITNTGGGCTAWQKRHENGSLTLITNGNLDHDAADFEGFEWEVGNYPASPDDEALMDGADTFSTHGRDHRAAIAAAAPTPG